MKQLQGIFGNAARHWVGDGFPVRTLFSYDDHGRHLDPFLMLDYAGPQAFSAGTRPRGVGSHPHRGFETVTLVYQGSLSHKDSSGAGGTVEPGDVQWMTAGAGVVHEEFHSQTFTENGGTFEAVQLWVNLPEKAKMTSPRYQTISATNIPKLDLPNQAGQLRVIAGELADELVDEFVGADSRVVGPAQTHTPLNLWEYNISGEIELSLPVPSDYNLGVVVLAGKVELIDGSEVTAGSVAVFSQTGAGLNVKASKDTRFIALSGQPLNEPVVGYGPFVMNSREEITQAINDYQQGKFGTIQPEIIQYNLGVSA